MFSKLYTHTNVIWVRSIPLRVIGPRKVYIFIETNEKKKKRPNLIVVCFFFFFFFCWKTLKTQNEAALPLRHLRNIWSSCNREFDLHVLFRTRQRKIVLLCMLDFSWPSIFSKCKSYDFRYSCQLLLFANVEHFVRHINIRSMALTNDKCRRKRKDETDWQREAIIHCVQLCQAI